VRLLHHNHVFPANVMLKRYVVCHIISKHQPHSNENTVYLFWSTLYQDWDCLIRFRPSSMSHLVTQIRFRWTRIISKTTVSYWKAWQLVSEIVITIICTKKHSSVEFWKHLYWYEQLMVFFAALKFSYTLISRNLL